MSLQVWLPLNEDLRNQGLNGVIPTNNGAVLNNAGKIGKCYQFGTAASDITLPATSMTSFTTEASISFWIKILSWNTSYATYFQAGTASTAWNAYIFGILRNNANSNLCFTISNGSSASNANYTTSNLELNTWYHLTFCYKTGHCLIYINGSLYSDYTTTIVPNFSGITTIKIGRCTNNSSYQTNCLLNDFRIYDHCLSQKEIEEISKGLVLHYKLDSINNNLLKAMAKAITPNGYNSYQLSFTENLVANETYTLQLWDVDVYHSAKTAAQTGVWIYWGGGSVSLFNWAGPTYFTPQGTNNYHADYLVKTFTVTSAQASGSGATNLWFNVYNSVGYVEGTMNMHIGGWKLEKGSTATSMSSTSIESNVIHDLSGYNNNGTVLNSLSIISDSPRYQTSLSFNGVDSGILIENLELSNIINNQITYSFWIKPNGENGGRSVYFGSYSGISWSIEKTAGNVLRSYWNGSPDLTCTGANITDGIWQHICIVKNGTSDLKVYINGIQKYSSTTALNALTFPTTYRIGRDVRTNDGTPYKGEMSDFRIYATALTEEQVLELYNTSATIDNKGNIYSRELVEI